MKSRRRKRGKLKILPSKVAWEAVVTTGSVAFVIGGRFDIF